MQRNSSKEITPLTETLIACRVVIKHVLLFGFVVNLLTLASSIYSMQVLDRVLSSYNLDTLLMLSLVITLALGLLSMVQAARAFMTNRIGNWFEHKLAETVFGNAVFSSLESRSVNHSQQLRDLQTVKSYITSPHLITMMDLPWAIIFLVVLFMLHSWMGWLAILGGFSLIVLGIVSDRSTRKLLESNNEHFIKSMRYAEQATKNAEVVDVMGLLPNVTRSWQKLNSKVQNTQSLAVERQAIFGEIIKFVRTILQIAVTGTGAYLVVKGQFSSGAIIASSTLIGRALAPFEIAIASWKGYITSKKSYSRLNASFIRRKNDDNLMALPAPEGYITCENIYFAPSGTQKYVVRGLSFAIETGKLVLIVGPSASGKTTLAKLLVGAYQPNVGIVRIDGVNLQDWRRQDLGPYIGYLPQDVELFSGTIKENIARMDPNPESDKVIEAAQIAGVHEMILQLPQGYDTEIGAEGSALSGGQRQRIALARAFYGDPRLLVLDEPNSSLDMHGEQALATAVEVAKERRITTVIVSHRQSLLQQADYIMLLSSGTITAYDKASEIIKKFGANIQNPNN